MTDKPVLVRNGRGRYDTDDWSIKAFASRINGEADHDYGPIAYRDPTGEGACNNVLLLEALKHTKENTP